MKSLVLFTILSFWVVDSSCAQSYSNETYYVIVDSTNNFTTSLWKRSDKLDDPVITVFNHFFEESYESAIKNKITKKYIFALFVLPDKENRASVWEIEKSDFIESKLLSPSALQNIVLQSFSHVTQHSFSNAITYNVKPVVKKNGKYYTTKNAIIGQCWEIINKETETPIQASSSTINTAANEFTESDIEQYRRSELEKMKVQTNSQYPIGGENIFANFVFLKERRILDETYLFWYKPTESFDGSSLEDGIVDFLYSPCIGIIGGSFKSYLRSLTNPQPISLLPKVHYVGFYKSYRTNNVSTELYIKECGKK